METCLDFLSLLILASSFVLVASKRISSYIAVFRVQSLILAIAAGLLGIHNMFSGGFPDVLILCAFIVILKVFYIPRLLHNAYQKVAYRVEKDFFLNIPISILICAGLVLFTYFCFYNLEGLLSGHFKSYFINSLSVVLIGLYFMITRKKAIGQIVGFLVLENGMFTMAMLSYGMPLIVDLGILVDLLTAVMIMEMLVYKINVTFSSIDINRLRKLRG